MSEQMKPITVASSLELSREELLRRARPVPPLEEIAIPDLTEEEWDAFWAAINE